MKYGPSIAFYDFDGTITTHDTMLELAKFKEGLAKYYLKLALLVPHFILHSTNLITNTRFKEAFLRLFFGGMESESLLKLSDAFCLQKMDSLIRKDALASINSQLQNDIPVIVVTASASIWVKPWCQKNGILLLASELEIVDGIITGKLHGKNCHGQEKVARIQAEFDLNTFDKILCYGDSPGDKPMLALATQPYYKPFL